MGRDVVRGILVLIIALTIPCYLAGIGVYFLTPGAGSPTSTPRPRPTFTALPTREATATLTPIFGLTDVVATATDFTFPTFAPTSDGGFSPILPPTNPPPPTQTPTPTFTPTTTATPIPAVTSTPTDISDPLPFDTITPP